MIAWRDKARRLGLWALCVSALLLGSSAAEAHLVTTGLGPAYDGIMHFLTSPEELVPVIALALLAGQSGPAAARQAVFVLPSAWFAGGIAGFAAAAAPAIDLTWLIFMLLGGLVAAHLRPPMTAMLALAALVGLFEGFLNGAAMSSVAGGIGSIIGIAATVFVTAALASAAAIAFTSPPAKIAVRILGSWTTATGLLLLGWSFR